MTRRIIICYSEPYNFAQTNNYYSIEIVIWNHIIRYKIKFFETQIQIAQSAVEYTDCISADE